MMGGIGGTGKSKVGEEEGEGTWVTTMGFGCATGRFVIAFRGALLRTMRWGFFVFLETRGLTFASAEMPKLGCCL
jgi:hypothetical protein